MTTKRKRDKGRGCGSETVTGGKKKRPDYNDLLERMAKTGTEMSNKLFSQLIGKPDVGPWRWSTDNRKWWLFGEVPIGTDWLGGWVDTCLSLTGHNEPPKPVRVPAWFTMGVGTQGVGWKIEVEAYPITSNGVAYHVWRDSRGVLRLIERET